MLSLLLAIIYLSFISLGLPDSLLGASWPSMYQELNMPIASAGVISMFIAGGTIVSSLISNRLIRKWGTGKVTIMSVITTAAALWGFSLSHSFTMLCILAIPYGLGAGAIDAALNNFVALNYKSKHMSWLHCFWGVGATLSPYIMGYSLAKNQNWNNGYLTVALIQFALSFILLLSLPLWRAKEPLHTSLEANSPSLSITDLLNLAGAKQLLIVFSAIAL